MELVYLWVEGYKNIEKEGFNFSPKFECRYNEKTKKLTIDEKEHLKDFFGENISITAIVGENGSGKSSILETISRDGILFKKDDVFYTIRKGEINCNFQYEIAKKEEFETIKLDYDFIKIKDVKDWYDLFGGDEPSSLYKKIENTPITETKLNIGNIQESIYNLILEHFEKFTLNTYIYTPLIIRIYLKDEKKLNEENEKLFQDFLKLFHINKEEKGKDIYLSDFNKYNKSDFFKLIEMGYISIDLIDKEEREYSSLSQGERKIFTDFLLIYDNIQRSSFENIILLLDEPDLTLHPYWQKKYISEMLKLLSNFPYKKFHIIITSHSPFIISDLPKENIIFLKKNKENGNCINVTKDININPFGANIHTLLSHGFFMQDGLMGEFAKGKIEDLINYLNDKKSDIKSNEEAQKLLNIIGEPVIKNQLQRMLDSKRLSKIDEIDKLSEEIELMKHRIEFLRKR